MRLIRSLRRLCPMLDRLGLLRLRSVSRVPRKKRGSLAFVTEVRVQAEKVPAPPPARTPSPLPAGRANAALRVNTIAFFKDPSSTNLWLTCKVWKQPTSGASAQERWNRLSRLNPPPTRNR
jgi:hypothetical protein